MSDEGVEYIRANQGHSLACVSTKEIMSRITEPSTVPLCVHGTYRKFLRSILSTGKDAQTKRRFSTCDQLPT